MTRDVRTRVLVTFGSSRGGTAGIATAIAEALRERGVAVDCLPVSSVHDLAPYDAVIIGGALYARRWIREVRRFVTRNMHELRRRPVWMFSSGPLDASAGHHELPPPPRVAVLMARVGARGHATFGGSLGPDAKGFPASVMATTRAGDWRDWEQIRSWALGVAHALAGTPRTSFAAPLPRPARWWLATLCLGVGVTAICGGVGLVARSDGSLLHVPLSALDHTPFTSFAIPGLLLLLVIGVGNVVAGALVIRDAPIANESALAGGAALLLWIVAEMVLLRTAHWLQLTYLVIGVAIIVEALRRRATQMHQHSLAGNATKGT